MGFNLKLYICMLLHIHCYTQTAKPKIRILFSATVLKILNVPTYIVLRLHRRRSRQLTSADIPGQPATPCLEGAEEEEEEEEASGVGADGAVARDWEGRLARTT